MFLDLLVLFFDVMLLSIILFSFILGILIIYFSPKGSRYQGLILVGVTVILGLLFYYFYAFNKATWRRIPVLETFFADLGATLGVIVVVSMLAAILILLQRER